MRNALPTDRPWGMPPYPDAARRRQSAVRQRLPGYALAAVVVLVAVQLAFVAERLLPHANLSLLFLAGVLIVASRAGLGPALLASSLCLIAYAFFFTPPYRSLGVAAQGDAATLAFFLIVAAVTGHLAARMRREIASNRAALARISKLFAFGARLSAAADIEAVLHALTFHLEQSLPGAVVVLLAEGDGPPVMRMHADSPGALSRAEIATAWADPSPEASEAGPWRFLCLKTNRATLGLVAVEARRVTPEQRELAASMCNQAALALDRIRLVDDVEQAKLASETERLRSALLSSVSHDLRTPLAAIIGATTSLLEYDEAISPGNRRELLKAAVAESQRLDRYVQNLLDMTRLGQGNLELHRDWVDVHDLVSCAVGRLRDALDGLQLEIRIAPDTPLVWVQGVLLEQALVNLLDNAARFSPPGGCIEIAVWCARETVEIEVCDEGPGIPAAERENVFTLFYTLSDADHGHLQGTGLGLAICRGILAAHGGKVTALDGRNGRGTCMRLMLPAGQPDQPREGL